MMKRGRLSSGFAMEKDPSKPKIYDGIKHALGITGSDDDFEIVAVNAPPTVDIVSMLSIIDNAILSIVEKCSSNCGPYKLKKGDNVDREKEPPEVIMISDSDDGDEMESDHVPRPLQGASSSESGIHR